MALCLHDPTVEVRTSYGQPCASESVVAALTGGARCAAEESSFWGAARRVQEALRLCRLCRSTPTTPPPPRAPACPPPAAQRAAL